jgi:hypothetical protein
MYISGQYFQQRCKWNLDNRYPIRKWNSIIELYNGDSVFLKISDISYFISLRLPKKVKLIVHNSDESFTDELYEIVKPYVTEVEAVNCVTKMAKQLPLGLRDHQYTSHHVLTCIINEPPVNRDILCLVNFLIATNPIERKRVYEIFKDKSYCFVQKEYMYYDKSLLHSHPVTQQMRVDFYRTLKRCKYAICPQGTGIDTHRVYECIHLGVIPIVLTSPLDSMYASMPVKIVKDWNEITEDFFK